MAYNAYLLAHTGAGEFGTRWPLFFQFYTGGFTQYAGPVQIYVLAVAFFLFQPSIVLARLIAAAWVFGACLLLGYLAGRIGRRPLIGIIVGLTALLTPWLVDLSRLVLDIFVYPMAIVLFLLVLYRAHSKERWTLATSVLLALTLALLTYTYTIGRALGPLLALGLLFFAINKQRLAGVIKTWIAYIITLAPLLVFNFRQPGQLMQRFYLISYVRPQSTLSALAPTFFHRYFEDLGVRRLLLLGDLNPRHHVPDSMGPVLVATFVLALMGIVVLLARHWRDPWWRFVLFGAAVSVVPGSLTIDPFHTLRMVAFPMFLLVLTIPALSWLLDEPKGRKDRGRSDGNAELEQEPAELSQYQLPFEVEQSAGLEQEPGEPFRDHPPNEVEQSAGLEQEPGEPFQDHPRVEVEQSAGLERESDELSQDQLADEVEQSAGLEREPDELSQDQLADGVEQSAGLEREPDELSQDQLADGVEQSAGLDEGQDEPTESIRTRRYDVSKIDNLFPKQLRRTTLAALVALTVVQGCYFQLLFHREGPKRGYVFDTSYKEVYDAATALPTRPIYLVDGYWGPAYINALWYATVERRPTSEFIHQPYGVRPPPGSLVISSENKCADCQMILQSGIYHLYRTH